MKRLELNTDDESLREILSNGKRYFIPKFQRDYSWDREHWDNLWQDILDLVQDKEKYHYMGYLVIQPPSSDRGRQRLKVIDGQQRLTTFSLFILAAIKKLDGLGDESERKNLLFSNFIGSQDFKYVRVENKLLLNRNNDYYYRKAVEGLELPKRGQKKTILLMEQALEYFYSKLKGYDSGEKIGELIDKISDRLLFTSIYIGDELNAYKVFETLNARGVQLSSGDLLKNYIFSVIDGDGKTPESVLDELDMQWDIIGGNIGSSNYSQFILSEWNSKNPLVRKVGVFTQIKRHINNKQAATTYLNDLESKSRVFAALLNEENEYWKDSSDYLSIKSALSCLRLFNIRQPISLLLAVYSWAPDCFARVLNWIKVLSIRYNIIGRKHTGEQELFYNKLAIAISNGEMTIDEVKTSILQFCPSDDDFRLAFSDKTMPTEQSNKKARYLLARLAEEQSDGFIDELNLTVEHILNFRPNDHWLDYFGDNWKLFNQRLGNMALVTKQDNEKLGQLPFSQKQSILQQTEYKINNLDEYDCWNSECVEHRQKQLADLAVQVWKI